MKNLFVMLAAIVPAIASAGLVVEDAAPAMAALGASAPAPDAPKIAVVKREEWVAQAGSSFRAEVQTWADKAGWKVVYDSKTDFRLDGAIRFEGRFDEAVAQFIVLFERSEKPLVADISLKQRLIYITNRGGQ